MKLLVTGGAGFMGSYFVKYVLHERTDWEIFTYDKLTYAGDTSKLADIMESDRHTFIEGDIVDGPHVEEVIAYYSVDAIVNFAAETHVDNSIEKADPFIRTNITGTHTLLEVARKYGIRMLQISTDEVYGSIEEGRAAETHCFEPNSPYSASKASADLLCRAYYQTYGVDVVGTHACNVIGPYQYSEKFLPTIVTNLLQDKQVPLYGDGMNAREWMYVEDHARAILLLLEQAASGERYNIGSGAEISNREMITKVLEIMGKDTSYITYVEDRKGHDRRYALDTRNIRALGWEPQYSLEETLRYVVRWYTENQSWWQETKSTQTNDNA